MSKSIADLVKEIQFIRDWNKELVAKNIGYSRVQLTRAEKSNDNPEIHSRLLEAYESMLQDDPTLMNQVVSRGKQNPQRDARDEELIQVLKKQNDFLERMLESSLSSLATTQQVVLAEVKAGLRYGALKDAGGNKKKEAEILAQISRTAGEYLQTFGVKDNASIVDR